VSAAGQFEAAHLHHDREGLEHKDAPAHEQHQRLMDQDGDNAQDTPSASDPVSPMNTSAGNAVEPEEPVTPRRWPRIPP